MQSSVKQKVSKEIPGTFSFQEFTRSKIARKFFRLINALALTFLNILLGLTFVGRSVWMWLFLKIGFWETGTWVRVLILVLGGRGFESTTLFFGGLWVSVHIFGGEVVGLSPHLCFLGVGVFFF